MTGSMIKVLLADDQALVRAGFRALLSAEADIEIVAEAGDGEEALLSPGVTRRLIEHFAAQPAPGRSLPALDALTDREREVLSLIAGGLTNDEIATRLVVSPLTAKTHVSRIMTKVGARDRAQLVVAAYETGLVRPGWTA